MPLTPLCAVADVVNAWPAFANINASEQTSLISTATEEIVGFCRRHGFDQTTEVETIDGKNLNRVWLTRRPVIAVMSIVINGDPLDNTCGDAWGFNAKTGELWRGVGYHDVRFGCKFPSGRQNIVVTYFAGYQTIPWKVNRAAIFYVRYLRDQIKASGVFSSESIGDYSYNLNAAGFAMTMPTHIANLLAEYVADDAFA